MQSTSAPNLGVFLANQTEPEIGSAVIYQGGEQWIAQEVVRPYVHTQAAPASTWTINHNLGIRPTITLFDDAGQEFDAQIVHVSVNQAIAYINPATAGTARCF